MEQSFESIITPDTIICPFCNTFSTIKIDPDSLQFKIDCQKHTDISRTNNYNTYNNFLKLQKSIRENYKCSNCLKILNIQTPEDFLICKECSNLYCNKCYKTHINPKNDSIKKKNIVNICSLSSDKNNLINNFYPNIQGLCTQHEKDYIKYCKNCRENLCIICKENHKEHTLIDLWEMTPTKVELDANKNLVQLEKNILSLAIQSLDEYVRKVNKTYQEFKKALNDVYEFKFRMIENVNNKCSFYEGLQNYRTMRTISFLNEELDNFRKAKSFIDKSFYFGEILMKFKKNNSEFNNSVVVKTFQTNKTLLEQVKELKQKYNTKLKVNELVIQKSFAETEKIEYITVNKEKDQILVCCDRFLKIYQFNPKSYDFSVAYTVPLKVSYVLILKNQDLAVITQTNSIEIIRLKPNGEVKYIQSVKGKADSGSYNSVIELPNVLLTSDDLYILKYVKNFYNNYVENRIFRIGRRTDGMLQIKENIVVTIQYSALDVTFIDINTFRIVKVLHNLYTNGGHQVISMVGKDNFVIACSNGLALVSVEFMEVVQFIDFDQCITCIYEVSPGLLVGGVRTGNEEPEYEFYIVEYEFDGREVVEVSKLKNVHSDEIWAVDMLKNGLFVTSSYDNYLKIFK